MKTLYICVGIPGCGKSTWTEKQTKDAWSSHVINMDAIRFEVTGNHSDQSKNYIVHTKAVERLKVALAEGIKNVFWDNTTVAPKYRKPLIQLAKDFKYRVVAVFFEVPLDVAKARNSGRSRVVPVEVLDRMFNSLIPPSLNEGFDEIIKGGN
jgi:predicted kinase